MGKRFGKQFPESCLGSREAEEQLWNSQKNILQNLLPKLRPVLVLKVTTSNKHCFVTILKIEISSLKVLSVTLKGVVRIFGTDSASEGAGLFKRRRKETEEVVNIEEKR